MSWTQFKEEFLDKFYPTVYKDQKIEEFFKLKQGTMSVIDYEKKFSKLVRHVPLFCDHEVQKSKRFVVGLRKEVKSILASVSHTQYGQVVEAAIKIEEFGISSLDCTGFARAKERWIYLDSGWIQ